MARPGEGFWKGREEALAAEWLETDGLGGYASSTITGMNTRRYHGLLVVATRPPVGRAVLLSKVEETLVVGSERFELAMNQYPGTISPEGDRFLKEFALDPFPRFVYEAGGVTLTKTLFLAHGESTLVVAYEVAGTEGRSVRLEVRPLLSYRDYHALGRERSDWRRAMALLPGVVTLAPSPDLPALSIAHDGAILEETGYWYRDVEYPCEKRRGFDFREDLFNPFQLVFDLAVKNRPVVVVSTNSRAAADEPELRRVEAERRARVEGSPEDPAALRVFRRAADQFLVARGASAPGGAPGGGGGDPARAAHAPATVIAGYPWFCDWGRDTMISLAGLTLLSERPEVARRILATYAGKLDRGMIPNRFPDDGETPEYNTVDATLWFIEAVRSYREATDDDAFMRELYPRLLEIVSAHERGTRYGIRLDADGLLASGAEGVQLTWMDARVGERVVTPRRGKPVEIQALWHNAVSFLAVLARDVSDPVNSERLFALALRSRESFERLFWNEEAGCLYDVVDGELRDASIRPNQLFAISLFHPLVTGARAERVLAVVRRDLLTPYGLRTLAPSDPSYIGRYEGGPTDRDGAYHQGTVWPWLLGPFVQATLRVNDTKEGRTLAAESLRPLVAYALGPGLGQLPEIFDGDAPHRSAGCFAQAWSVAQVIQAVNALGRGPLPSGASLTKNPDNRPE